MNSAYSHGESSYCFNQAEHNEWMRDIIHQARQKRHCIIQRRLDRPTYSPNFRARRVRASLPSDALESLEHEESPHHRSTSRNLASTAAFVRTGRVSYDSLPSYGAPPPTQMNRRLHREHGSIETVEEETHAIVGEDGEVTYVMYI
jgi:hypothetical protein